MAILSLLYHSHVTNEGTFSSPLYPFVSQCDLSTVRRNVLVMEKNWAFKMPTPFLQWYTTTYTKNAAKVEF